MEITSNPMRSLEESIYKNLSREKISNQNQRKNYIEEAERITAAQSREYEVQAMFTIACLIATVSLSVLAAVVDLKINQDTPANKATIDDNLKRQIDSLKYTTSVLQILAKTTEQLPAIKNSFSQSKLNQLQHRKQLQEMHLSHLNQERSNSQTQTLLHEVKDTRRRKQQARAATNS
jgi:hypothetical protein